MRRYHTNVVHKHAQNKNLHSSERSAHAHESYSSLFVYVCYHSSASVRCVCDKLNLPARSSLNPKGFQLADFAKMLSFLSYSLFFAFTNSSKLLYVASSPDDLYLRVFKNW